MLTRTTYKLGYRFLGRIARIEYDRMDINAHLLLRRSFRATNDHRSVLSQAKQAWNNTSTQWYALPAAFGIGYLSLLVLYKSQKRASEDAIHTRVEGPLHIRLYASLPLRYISQCWGWINNQTVPVPLRAPLYKLYSFLCGCNLDEMEQPDLTQYANLGEFFYRKIKPSVRTIDMAAPLISPVDGRVLHFGVVDDDEVEQVKGVTYSLNALLGPNPKSTLDPHKVTTYYPKSGNNLFYTTIYLAPGDYHRFHSPTELRFNYLRHFAGEMYSVSPSIVQKIPNLFALNERVSLLGEWKYGLFAYVAVAATNVGQIVINDSPNLLTNVPAKMLDRPLGTSIEEFYEDVKYSRGEEVGGFKLGSTIVMVFEAPKDFKFAVESGQKIQLGQKLGEFSAQ